VSTTPWVFARSFTTNLAGIMLDLSAACLCLLHVCSMLLESFEA
jgi:hypothetical protein